MSSVPIADGLFTWPSDEPCLIGSTCRDCGTTAFPRQDSCSKCTSVAVEERLLDRRGVLWSFTVQGFRPKEPYAGPQDFKRFGVGYVELPGQVIVESVLTERDPAALKIGMPMELVIVPFDSAGDGPEVLTYAFRPSGRATR